LISSQKRKNIIMYGRTGTGKTMLSIALGVTACQNGISVKFYRTAALVNQLSEAKATGTLGTLLKKLNRASVLILDEWGYVPYDRTGAQLLFDYLSEIHEHKSIVLNTNLEFSRWVNVLYDEQMTAALVGRLMHHCHLLLFPGENNRLRESSINELYRSIAVAQEVP
jgi:DNA replication protein DnaC